MKNSQYTIDEMRQLLSNMSGMYDMARIVDPIECRIINIKSDGTVSMDQKCYGIWNAGTKCSNYSSAAACKTGCHQEKSEYYDDKVFHIQSNPVTLKLPDGGAYEAVVELVNINDKEKDLSSINDRAAENVDHKAALYQLKHDEMTKLLNPGPFYEICRQTITDSLDPSWVMITGNIKNFKLVNTLFGDQKGNELLFSTANELRNIADKNNGLCGRLGGDQFAMLLRKKDFNEEELFDVQRRLADSFNCGIYTYIIHFGVYEITDTVIPISVMCGRANSALRTIRDSLTETVAYFDSKMLKKDLFEQEIIGGFSNALKNNEFKMYLQPLADEKGTIYGAEALARWIKPDGTMIMPGDFIEILEQAGLIHELDVYIWECAVKKLSEWKNTIYEDMTISVNMSPKDFFSVDVYGIITDLVEKYGIDTNKLRLEITETCLLEEPDKSGEIIKKLRDYGFLVEIDDFGKGFSSLSMLRQIQADVLKIDMSLLHEIDIRYRSKIILKSIINMAHDLGMDVITEGIENASELKELTEMDCHRFQGFYFSKPIAIDEFEAKLADRINY